MDLWVIGRAHTRPWKEKRSLLLLNLACLTNLKIAIRKSHLSKARKRRGSTSSHRWRLLASTLKIWETVTWKTHWRKPIHRHLTWKSHMVQRSSTKNNMKSNRLMIDEGAIIWKEHYLTSSPKETCMLLQMANLMNPLKGVRLKQIIEWHLHLRPKGRTWALSLLATPTLTFSWLTSLKCLEITLRAQVT